MTSAVSATSGDSLQVKDFFKVTGVLRVDISHQLREKSGRRRQKRGSRRPSE